MPKLRVALAQTNPVLGAWETNSTEVVAQVAAAAAAGADLVAFGEMVLSGYPIEDLASNPGFLRTARSTVDKLAADLHAAGLGDIPVVVGHPDGPFAPRAKGTSTAPTAIAQNCASVLQGGKVVARYAKHHLPNYSVFDEYRIFIPGDELLVFSLGGVDVALMICEDLWRDGGPIDQVRASGAGMLLVINGSPYERDKDEVRLPLATRRAAETGTTVAYVNLVGGQDDLVFDGDSVIVTSSGEVVSRAPQFVPHLIVADLELPAPAQAALPAEDIAEQASEAPFSVGRVSLELPRREKPALDTDIAELPDDLEQIWNALVLGLGDYVDKNGFRSVVLGLSGGIDSAVCAALAVDAIGASRVFGVSMPSKYSSGHSRSDAEDLAERLGVDYRTEAIADLVLPFETQLGLTGVAAENLQARVRGVILMGLSNQEGHLVLTTGNKSELSVGYSTIYGDSVGGFAPLKDVPKSLVWELARWRNRHAASAGLVEPIPENSIEKPPSAELRPDQTDQDSLPDYDVLDEILDRYVGRQQSVTDIAAAGFDQAEVSRVVDLVNRAEWKRRQGAIGPKISAIAFGRDRRLPITSR